MLLIPAPGFVLRYDICSQRLFFTLQRCFNGKISHLVRMSECEKCSKRSALSGSNWFKLKLIGGRPVYADPEKGEKSDIFLLNANKPQKVDHFRYFCSILLKPVSASLTGFNNFMILCFQVICYSSYTVERISVSPNPRPNEEPIASASSSLADIIEEIWIFFYNDIKICDFCSNRASNYW